MKKNSFLNFSKKRTLKNLFKLSKKREGFKFVDVIKVKTGKRIIKFDKYININLISLTADEFVFDYNQDPEKFLNYYTNGILNIDRTNEFGNLIEKIFINYFFKKNNDTTPKYELVNVEGKGYPDFVMKNNDRTIYMEIKTYGEKNNKSSNRTFYYSYGKTNKITNDGYHVLLGFEKNNEDKIYKNNNKTYKIPIRLNHSKIIDLSELEVDFKIEFNTGNDNLYN